RLMNAPEWVRENYPKFANCEKKPLPHVDYEIISIRQLTAEEYQERVNKWNEKQSKTTTE
ncbi:MAG: hypothetical protein IK085_05460, partial [Clostridia bacterium]|nr:hypothetical protein [Clostridia bacterium]